MLHCCPSLVSGLCQSSEAVLVRPAPLTGYHSSVGLSGLVIHDRIPAGPYLSSFDGQHPTNDTASLVDNFAGQGVVRCVILPLVEVRITVVAARVARRVSRFRVT